MADLRNLLGSDLQSRPRNGRLRIAGRWIGFPLHGSELARDGYLRGERVAQLVGEHLEGRRDHGNRIWLLLTAEVWYRHFIGRRSAEDLEAELAEAGGGAAPRVAAAASQR